MVSEFEKTINYEFKSQNLILHAFVHSSYSHENNLSYNNERLEFLGDAVLELISSEYLYREFAQMSEGNLTKLRANVVCESSLANAARKLKLGEFLKLGKGEELSGGRMRDSILSDAFEAVIGAVYLDGGYEPARLFVINMLGQEAKKIGDSLSFRDYKTALQELVQKTSKYPLIYSIIKESGPDHNKLFTAQVFHSNIILGTGTGKSKKEAEQSAAYTALQSLQV